MKSKSWRIGPRKGTAGLPCRGSQGPRRLPQLARRTWGIQQTWSAHSQRFIAVKGCGLKSAREGLPWWSSGQESALGCREGRLDPSELRIPHSSEQLLSLRALEPGTAMKAWHGQIDTQN